MDLVKDLFIIIRLGIMLCLHNLHLPDENWKSQSVTQMSPNVWVFIIAKEHLDGCKFFSFYSCLWHRRSLGFSCSGYSTINSLNGMGRCLAVLQAECSCG